MPIGRGGFAVGAPREAEFGGRLDFDSPPGKKSAHQNAWSCDAFRLREILCVITQAFGF